MDISWELKVPLNEVKRFEYDIIFIQYSNILNDIMKTISDEQKISQCLQVNHCMKFFQLLYKQDLNLINCNALADLKRKLIL